MIIFFLWLCLWMNLDALLGGTNIFLFLQMGIFCLDFLGV